jgi:predicted nucleotidyltransferase
MVAIRDIRKFAHAIAREFKPRRIILFGSYAYGKPTEDSDVDLLVIFPGRGSAVEKSLEIRLKIRRPFALDLLTRTTGEVAKRVAMEDWFMCELLEKGKVLYEAKHARMDRQGRR